MQITAKQVKNLSYVIVDGLYSPDELERIKTELCALTMFAQNPQQVGAELTHKKGMGVFLDTHYQDREDSDILTLNRKLFNQAILKKAVELNQLFYALDNCTLDYTLINYYKNGDAYKPHPDETVLTAVTFFSLGHVSGGDLEFPEVNEVVPFKENRAVIFPGCALHAVKDVVASEGSFRVSMAQFLNYR